MEQKRLCPYCMGELPPAADSCVHCGKVFAGRNPAGCLPVGTVLAGRYTVGEMRSLDGEGILYRGVENLGCFRVTIKEYLPVTLSAERGADCILQPKTGSEVLFKTTRMDFADLYRALERITPATGLEAVLDVVEANNTVYAVMENLGGTPLDQWLENHPGVHSETVQVRLSEFADSSIDIAVQFYTKTTDIVEYRAVKEDVNLRIMDIMAGEGASFAFPSRSIYIENAPSLPDGKGGLQ